MVPNLAVVNSASLQRLMDLIISPLVTCIHKRMVRLNKGVQIVKRLLKKASDSNADPYLALLSYRAASLECGASPTELLMRRKLRTTLPHILENDDNRNDDKLADKWMRLKHRQKMNYDRTARSLEPLQERDSVKIEGPDFWARKATVLGEVGPRSFVIETEDGKVLRRNRRSLLKTQDSGNKPKETRSVQQDGAAMMLSRVNLLLLHK